MYNVTLMEKAIDRTLQKKCYMYYFSFMQTKAMSDVV